MQLFYLAYPTSLTLQSANAIQTHTTLRELRALAPNTLPIIPRWPGEPTRFDEVGALHLIRPAIGKLSRVYKTTLLYYAERTVFAAMAAAVVNRQRRGPAAVYVREALLAGWWASTWGPRLRIPVIYEAHDLESWNPSRAKERWAQPLLNLLDKSAIQRSQGLVSLTDDFRQLLGRIGWRTPQHVAVIPDAFDATVFAPGDRNAARHALGLTGGPLLVYAGMTFAYRSLDQLIAVLPQLRQQHPDAQIILVGGRPAERAALTAQAQSLGVANAVRCVGQLPQAQVLPYLHAADLLVIPNTVTDVTASPLKLFEYLAVGQPVVLPDIPALAEILPAGVGYTFARGDATALLGAIETALADPQRAHRAAQGVTLVQTHSYRHRAQRILDYAAQFAR